MNGPILFFAYFFWNILVLRALLCVMKCIHYTIKIVVKSKMRRWQTVTGMPLDGCVGMSSEQEKWMLPIHRKSDEYNTQYCHWAETRQIRLPSFIVHKPFFEMVACFRFWLGSFKMDRTKMFGHKRGVILCFFPSFVHIVQCSKCRDTLSKERSYLLSYS